MDKIRTISTSGSTMDINPIVLRQNNSFRLSFFPKWVEDSDNKLRGVFRIERKGPNDIWEPITTLPSSKLKKDEYYEIQLYGDDMATLLGNLEDIKALLSEHGYSYGTRTFSLNEYNVDQVLIQVGNLENRDLIVEQLKKLEEHQFENLSTVINTARMDGAIQEYEQNMDNTSEEYWQNFFERNPWILQQVFAFPVIYLNGETYLGGKSSSGRQGSGGSATDFLCMHGSHNSLAVVEIKKPLCNLTGSIYRGEEGSGDQNELYRIHGDLSGGIVQLENQLHTATHYFSSTVGETYPKLKNLSPSGILIAGNYSLLNAPKRKSFDLFRKSLGKNQVLTFDEVLVKLKLLRDLN
jgi:hypothetical protein